MFSDQIMTKEYGLATDCTRVEGLLHKLKPAVGLLQVVMLPKKTASVILLFPPNNLLITNIMLKLLSSFEK